MAKKKIDNENGSTGGLDAPGPTQPIIAVFLLKSVSDLLQNNPASFIDSSNGDAPGLGSKKVYKDDEEARLRVYVDENGAFAHPSEAFLRSMIRAVTGMKLGKRSAPARLRGSVFTVENYAPLLDHNGKALTKYAIDKRSVVVNKKARVMRCRPCWRGWSIRLPLEIDLVMVTPEQVAEALSLAGKVIGIGDFRPEKGGKFGRFTCELVK